MKKELLKLSPEAFCKKTGACAEGVKFARQYNTMREVWDACDKVSWLVWILNAIDAPQDEKACRLYMVWCARNTPLADGRTTLALLTNSRSITAIDVVERFANGNATEEEMSAAESAAESAASDGVQAYRTESVLRRYLVSADSRDIVADADAEAAAELERALRHQERRHGKRQRRERGQKGTE